MMLYTFDDMGDLEFPEDAFDKLVDEKDGAKQITDLLNFVKFNTSITKALNGLVDAGIVNCSDEDGNPTDVNDLKDQVTNNGRVIDWLVNRYNLTLWTDAEMEEMAKEGFEANNTDRNI